jgi:predicted nucleic acid-binding protein
MNKILIDSDVILDFFFDRLPFSESASEILMLCEKNEISGYVTPVIISNLYYLLRKNSKHEKVIDHLRKLLSILETATMNKQIVLNALNSNFIDFEDALQNYTADFQNEIQVIVTRNTKDFKTSRLSVMAPETYLKSIKK